MSSACFAPIMTQFACSPGQHSPIILHKDKAQIGYRKDLIIAVQLFDTTINPYGRGSFKAPAVLKIIKNRLLEIAFQIFFPAFLVHYSSCEK